MVRLKEDLFHGIMPNAQLFQFHYGTIKSQAAQRYSLWQDAFQFHYGTIKSAVETFSELRSQISIPLWYD